MKARTILHSSGNGRAATAEQKFDGKVVYHSHVYLGSGKWEHSSKTFDNVEQFKIWYYNL